MRRYIRGGGRWRSATVICIAAGVLAGGVASVLDSGGAVGGALPGVAGVSGMTATVTGLGAALIAVLPAITSVLGGFGRSAVGSRS